MKPIIKVENLSKNYLIKHQYDANYETLRDTIVDGFKNISKRMVGKKLLKTKEEFWALKDINFSVEKGEKLGIIGKNGSGKSTLLKILSRITEPASGRVHIDGSVRCLLEVGTGFHEELTGRENIYLNGSIIGMKLKEINENIDDIIQFSGVEKFLDTPVKRYSSGMKVRLGFSVAAHLSTDILIIDEVLAVGDVEFQARCLGKMNEVASKGRTILFVSHDMEAVENLCERVMLLKDGEIVDTGKPVDVIERYKMSSLK